MTFSFSCRIRCQKKQWFFQYFQRGTPFAFIEKLPFFQRHVIMKISSENFILCRFCMCKHMGSSCNSILRGYGPPSVWKSHAFALEIDCPKPLHPPKIIPFSPKVQEMLSSKNTLVHLNFTCINELFLIVIWFVILKFYWKY